jgi:hypothetical protein
MWLWHDCRVPCDAADAPRLGRVSTLNKLKVNLHVFRGNWIAGVGILQRAAAAYHAAGYPLPSGKW